MDDLAGLTVRTVVTVVLPETPFGLVVTVARLRVARGEASEQE